MDDSYTDFTYHGQDKDNDDNRFIYIGSKVRIVHTTNSMFLRIFRTRFQRLGQAKQREREMGRAERAVQPFGTLIWILNFPPREHNVEQDVVHPHQQTTGTTARQTQSSLLR